MRSASLPLILLSLPLVPVYFAIAALLRLRGQAAGRGHRLARPAVELECRLIMSDPDDSAKKCRG
jgi:hypothetical protein